MAASVPYFKLSSFYFFYFAALGAFAPYWAVYLKNHLHFSSREIGELLAIFMFTKLVAPLVWSWLADYFDKSLSFIRLSSVLTVISFLGVYLNDSYGWMAIIMFVFGFFWNAALPQYETITLNHLGHKTHRYSRIRLWGSIGFIVMVVGLPMVVDGEKIAQLPHYLLFLFIVLSVTTWLVRDKPHYGENIKKKSSGLFFNSVLVAFLVTCVLQTMSHGAYYTFFSIYLEAHGYLRFDAGLLWALGTLAEVGLFIVLCRLMERFSVYHLFSLSLFLTAVRWVFLGLYVDNLWLLIFSQLLHAASFGLFHASAIHLVHSWFSGSSQGKGQALYAALSFGLGGALGSVLSGYLWENVTTQITFLIMSLFALLATGIAWRFVRESEINRETKER